MARNNGNANGKRPASSVEPQSPNNEPQRDSTPSHQIKRTRPDGHRPDGKQVKPLNPPKRRAASQDPEQDYDDDVLELPVKEKSMKRVKMDSSSSSDPAPSQDKDGSQVPEDDAVTPEASQESQPQEEGQQAEEKQVEEEEEEDDDDGSIPTTPPQGGKSLNPSKQA